MTPEKPEHRGRFVKRTSVRPAVEVDCSAWAADSPQAGWTTGRFVRNTLMRPAVEVDCSGWPQTLPALEITLHPDPAADAVQLALGLADVVSAVDRVERALGGVGLSRTAGGQADGAVTLTLVPEQPNGAADRIRQICDILNQESAAIPLPPVVRTLRARVA